MKIGHIKIYGLNDDGVVTGGASVGTGATIAWQSGPLARSDDGSPQPNGAFVEDVIEMARDRLQAMQGSKFRCDENEKAIAMLDGALAVLDQRTQRREAEGVLGTHELVIGAETEETQA